MPHNPRTSALGPARSDYFIPFNRPAGVQAADRDDAVLMTPDDVEQWLLLGGAVEDAMKDAEARTRRCDCDPA